MPVRIIMFSLTLHQGVIPNEWKCAIITSIYRKGSHIKPMNYRPVSLTLIMCHILKSIITEKIMGHLL